MKGIKALFLLAVFPVSCTQYNSITKEELADKIKGGWAGKMIGVSYGIQIEFNACGKTFEGPLSWAPDKVEYALRDDDLYGQLHIMSSMEKHQGLKTPVTQLGFDFAHAGFTLCHANMQGRKNILDGIMPPLSGHAKYNMHANDIDFQIESDFIGIINPGMPHSAALMADSVGRIMCYGDGLYGGMFVSAMHALAYFEKDAKVIVEKALKCIPAESLYANAIQTVIDGYKSNPKEWRKTWAIVQEKFGEIDICVPFNAFNIDAAINGAFVVMGLMFGENDMGKTIEIAARCGQDSDCNAANAGAVIGIMMGYNAIEDIYKSHIPKIEDKLFVFTDYSFKKAALQSLIFAEENILANGGRIRGNVFKIKNQKPQFTGILEQSFPGMIPGYMVLMTDNEQYTIAGNWEDYRGSFKASTQPGDIFEIKFKGSGITIKGRYGIDGGNAMAYIDGQPLREFNCYSYGKGDCGNWVTNLQHLIHAMNLEEGEHTLKIEVLDKKHPESTGHKIYIERAIIYKKHKP